MSVTYEREVKWSESCSTEGLSWCFSCMQHGVNCELQHMRCAVRSGGNVHVDTGQHTVSPYMWCLEVVFPCHWLSHLFPTHGSCQPFHIYRLLCIYKPCSCNASIYVRVCLYMCMCICAWCVLCMYVVCVWFVFIGSNRARVVLEFEVQLNHSEIKARSQMEAGSESIRSSCRVLEAKNVDKVIIKEL